MKSKKIIAITGSIATGKSTATNIIRTFGYVVIDADKIAHNLMKKDEANYKNIVEYFGKSILKDNGKIMIPIVEKINVRKWLDRQEMSVEL